MQVVKVLNKTTKTLIHLIQIQMKIQLKMKTAINLKVFFILLINFC